MLLKYCLVESSYIEMVLLHFVIGYKIKGRHRNWSSERDGDHNEHHTVKNRDGTPDIYKKWENRH